MSSPPDLPPIVSQTLDLSRRRGFITSTRNETGRLLATLAATRRGTLAELGTGCGVGSAWLHSGAPADANIDVISGDWSALEALAPFSLLFVDVREVMADMDHLAGLLEPGGIAVLDDFVPSETWPPIVDGKIDLIREAWLTDSRFAAVEMLIDASASVIIATLR